MELHQPIADSNTGFAGTPKRDFHELTNPSLDDYQQCYYFGIPAKRTRTLGSDNESNHAEPFSGGLDQRDELLAANHGMLGSLSNNLGINYEGFPEYPTTEWAFEDNFDNSYLLLDQSLANNSAGLHPIVGGLVGITSEIVGLTLPDAEGFDEASPYSDSEQPSDKDGVLTSTHNSPGTPLSTPDGEISHSKPTSDDKSSETLHVTCFGYASPPL